MSRYDDDWNRDSHRAGRQWSTFERAHRREIGQKSHRGGYLLTLALLVMLSTLGVATINLLGYQLM
ncbi:MAG TPA: hypothetical protein VH353_09340 [Caulobacteraceae bacterium]|jgi:hypothetical protein|nr:hypothetical protein [Caulobacteraceae bacterium]